MAEDVIKNGVKDIQLNAEPDHVVNGAWITGLIFAKSHGMNKLQAMVRLHELGVPSRPFFYPLSSLPAYSGSRKNTSRATRSRMIFAAEVLICPAPLT